MHPLAKAKPKRSAPCIDWRAALGRLEGAYSANTIRAYRADFAAFESWCEAEGRTALPAAPETVADFLRAESESAAPATVSRRGAAISKIHKLLKLENPTQAEDVILATRAVFRSKGRRQEQALGLTADLKRRLIRVCPKDLRGLRDKALIATGYDTLCRRAELVALRIEDLNIQRDSSGTILVRKSKADQLGHGRLAYLSPEAVEHLTHWLKASGLKSGPVFRKVHRKYIGDDPLDGASVPPMLKQRAIDARLERDVVEKLSGHSMRVGAAQDMAAAGIDLVAIMHAGGWKSPEMVMRYIEHMDVQKSGMARLYDRTARLTG